MTEENKTETPEEVSANAENLDQAAIDQAEPESPEADAQETPSTPSPDDEANVDPEAAAIMDESDDDQPDPAENEADAGGQQGDASEADAEADMLAMLEDLPQEDSGARPEDIDFGSATAAKAEFQQLTESTGKEDKQNIDLLLDVNLPVSIELGRTRMTIEDILALGPGSVVELNKLAGEPVDLLVNYKVVARGEVVVIDENFGVRITQLLSPDERLRALGDQ